MKKTYLLFFRLVLLPLRGHASERNVSLRSSTLFRGDIIEEIEWPISELLQYDANQISVARSKI